MIPYDRSQIVLTKKTHNITNTKSSEKNIYVTEKINYLFRMFLLSMIFITIVLMITN